MKNKTYKVDKRCPRGLKVYPKEESFCKLAVLELKKLRNSQEPISENEHSFCPWFVNSQSAYYCFWVYMQKVLDTRKQMSETEMAHLLCTDVNDIKNIEKDALKKIKDTELYYELLDYKRTS